MTALSKLEELLKGGKASHDGSIATQALAIVRRAPLYRPDLAMALAEPARAANGIDYVTYWDVTEQLAVTAADRGDWLAFDRVMDQVRARFPKSWRTDMLFGYLSEVRGAWGIALKTYMDVVEDNPLKSGAYKRQIAVLKAQRKVPEAIALLNYFLQHFSCDLDAWAELAALCLAEGRMEHALFAANEVLMHSGGGHAAHALVADIHMTIGGFQQFLSARRHYSASLSARRKGNMRALYGLWLAATSLQLENAWAKPAFSDALDGDGTGADKTGSAGGGDGQPGSKPAVTPAEMKEENQRAVAWAVSAIQSVYQSVDAAEPGDETAKRKQVGRGRMSDMVRHALATNSNGNL
jgi:hypothetical protein